MNPETAVPTPFPRERPREFFRRVCLAGNQPTAQRPRGLALRLRELGFRVYRVTRRGDPLDLWEIHVRPIYEGFPPPVEVFRERLQRALRAQGCRCAKSKIRIKHTGLRLEMSFPWPDQTGSRHARTTD
jgi:hypothetical protein